MGLTFNSVTSWLESNAIWQSWKYPLIKLYPDDLDAITEYQDRLQRLRLEIDSDCSPAHSMFMLEKYKGEKAYFSVDTSNNLITRCVFVEKYEGERKFFPTFEIIPQRKGKA